MSTKVPELEFDDDLAVRYFPVPVIKRAVLVPVQDQFAGNIRPEWDDTGLNPQVFIGSYYLVVDGRGVGRYGSAAVQWRNMHRQLTDDPMAWVKILCPVGYLTDSECAIVTLIPDAATGGFQEARKIIAAGTLVLRQPGGEVQHVRADDQAATYYSPAQATALGLTGMTSAEFAEWALRCAASQQVWI